MVIITARAPKDFIITLTTKRTFFKRTKKAQKEKGEIQCRGRWLTHSALAILANPPTRML